MFLITSTNIHFHEYLLKLSADITSFKYNYYLVQKLFQYHNCSCVVLTYLHVLLVVICFVVMSGCWNIPKCLLRTLALFYITNMGLARYI